MYNKVKTPDEISAIRESGRMLATVHEKLKEFIKPGITTKEIDEYAIAETRKLGGIPAFLGYQGFPGGVCTSINDAVVHGIPGDIVLNEGDIISLDYGVTYGGMITDAARTYVVGGTEAASKQVQKLISDTQRSLDMGIAQIKPGARIGDISSAVQKVLDDGGYGIVRDLVGHGVGHQLHESPEIPNYGHAGTGPVLKEGMTIAIEPMSTLGDWKVVVDPDGWTIRTRDGSLSSHSEDTILVTADGAEILTRL